MTTETVRQITRTFSGALAGTESWEGQDDTGSFQGPVSLLADLVTANVGDTNLFYVNGSGVLTPLALGSGLSIVDDALTASGSSGPYSTTTISNTTTASVTIDIPSGFKNAELVVSLASNGTDSHEDRVYISVNGDVTQSDYASFPYYWYTGSADGSGFQSGAPPWTAGLGYMLISIASADGGNVIPTAGRIFIDNYGQSSFGVNVHGKSWMSTNFNSRIWEAWINYSPPSLEVVSSVTLSVADNSGNPLMYIQLYMS